MLEDLGFIKILEFKQVPCEVYFNPEKAITLSVGVLDNYCWLKASKHMYIKALERSESSLLYSKLQSISKFMEYLKSNLPEFQSIVYFISDITPKIAISNFRGLLKLEEIYREYEDIENKLKRIPIDERKLELVKKIWSFLWRRH